MIFDDRIQAAELLAQRLERYRGQNPLVLAIPRGAVPMARVIADALEGDLDVVLVHKLGAPFQPEFAIGSVSESGDVYLGDLVQQLEIGQEYIDREVERELETLRQRRARYTPVRKSMSAQDRIAIVVDNGVATGWTMLAALRAVRRQQPKKLVAAMAAAPADSLPKMEAEADEIVCLTAPEDFLAVGQFFLDFRQVTDEEVVEVLRKAPAVKRQLQGGP
jgi:predicted phosphoribosyltransferase